MNYLYVIFLLSVPWAKVKTALAPTLDPCSLRRRWSSALRRAEEKKLKFNRCEIFEGNWKQVYFRGGKRRQGRVLSFGYEMQQRPNPKQGNFFSSFESRSPPSPPYLEKFLIARVVKKIPSHILFLFCREWRRRVGEEIPSTPYPPLYIYVQHGMPPPPPPPTVIFPYMNRS